jgi:hypothetical protein
MVRNLVTSHQIKGRKWIGRLFDTLLQRPGEYFKLEVFMFVEEQN